MVNSGWSSIALAAGDEATDYADRGGRHSHGRIINDLWPRYVALRHWHVTSRIAHERRVWSLLRFFEPSESRGHTENNVPLDLVAAAVALIPDENIVSKSYGIRD